MATGIAVLKKSHPPCPTGCGKPAFFESRKPLFEVHTSTGMLRNTDSGNPMVPIGELHSAAALCTMLNLPTFCLRRMMPPSAPPLDSTSHVLPCCPGGCGGGIVPPSNPCWPCSGKIIKGWQPRGSPATVPTSGAHRHSTQHDMSSCLPEMCALPCRGGGCP